jgi:hypothetical protein
MASLGHDDASIRLFLAERADDDFEMLIAPIARGRLTPDTQRRRDALAQLTVQAREAGARIEALARVLRRPVSVVKALEDRGRALRG